MDQELKDLCKDVFKRTGWGMSRPHESTHMFEADTNGDLTSYPLYTSDYLLEKLKYWTLQSKQNGFKAEHRNGNDKYTTVHADTPLKALLKLTIALHESKELKL